jgi:hypothetical protein
MRMSHSKCLVGYVRVSTDYRAGTAKLAELRAAEAKRIYSEKVSGKNAERAELPRCLRTLQPGDVLLVRKLDLLARSIPDTFRILETIKDRGAFIKALDELSAFAAIERKMIRTGCEEGSEGRWRTLLGSGQSLSSTLTTGNRLGGCCRMGNRSERSARLLGVDHQSNSRSAPQTGGAFILLGNPQRLHPVNDAKTGRQRSWWSLSALVGIINRWARQRSASEGQVAHATW